MKNLSHIVESLRPLATPIDDLHLDPANGRTGHAVDRIAASLTRYGQRKPLVVNRNENNKIEAGNGTWQAAKSLGWQWIAAVFVEDDPMTAVGYGIADNRLGDLSEWDGETLQTLIDSLDPDLNLPTGFDKSELDELLAGLETAVSNSQDTEPQTSRADELRQEWQTETGQLWILPSRDGKGEHRLIVGDCTDRAVVERVMGGERAELLFTSPPYDDMRTYDGNDLSVESLAQIFPVWRGFANYFAINLGIKRKNNEVIEYWDGWKQAAKETNLKLLSWNVWDKGMAGSIANQSAMFSIIHEFIFVFGDKAKDLNRIYPNDNDANVKRRRYDPIDSRGKKQRLVRQADGTTKYSSRGDLFTEKQIATVHPITPEMARTNDHPAMFPVILPQEYIKSFTDKGGFISDPFSGSGTTLIACENLSRYCRAVEISPAYSAVILQRYFDTFQIRPYLAP